MSPSRALVVLACAAALSCGRGDTVQRPYDNNDLQLVTSYTAKDFCSCVFVMEMSEEYCRRWTAASPAVATVTVDYEERSVQTAAALLWGEKARFVSERDGCVLE
ncbi:hypothetical protein BO221_34210 [Archangium sp. Cb G35]|uniref:hypothetical protein n=1 Tax=Archangium sp. Cb G35 TaxID=1920190 RepID=UPI000937458C|nr:hypothetical protein [Archangium sp. Cb G35]OJT19443.1 hypothetical protein BO221_34210 [Archangium sp. Cb G35]